MRQFCTHVLLFLVWGVARDFWVLFFFFRFARRLSVVSINSANLHSSCYFVERPIGYASSISSRLCFFACQACIPLTVAWVRPRHGSAKYWNSFGPSTSSSRLATSNTSTKVGGPPDSLPSPLALVTRLYFRSSTLLFFFLPFFLSSCRSSKGWEGKQKPRLTVLTDHTATCVVQQQIQEMEAIRHTVMTLEATHTAMKQKCVFCVWRAPSNVRANA